MLQLWDSWEPDAIIADKESGIYADPAKVHVVHHEGKYYRCHGRHFCAPSPQGRPVLWQAGSSDRGRDFAAKHAEAIFAVHPNVERMRQYTDDLTIVCDKLRSRRRDRVKLIYGLQTVVAETRSEAQEKHERIKACIPPEGALGMDLRPLRTGLLEYSPDEIVQNIEVPGIQGLFESIIYAKGGAPVTVNEAAMIYAQGWACRSPSDTSDIADQMEHYMDDGGADGFMLIATYTPGCFEEFVDLVVPELQRRGRFRSRYADHAPRPSVGELARFRLEYPAPSVKRAGI